MAENVFQCQACGVESTSRVFSQGMRLPWKCPKCGARHEYDMSMSIVGRFVLLDRFTLRTGHPSEGAVRTDLEEAVRAFNADCVRGAVVLARRALERRLTECGATKDNLVGKIDELAATKRLDRAHVAAATAVRQFGNYGAHPNDDLLDDVDAWSAETALRAAVTLLEDLA